MNPLSSVIQTKSIKKVFTAFAVYILAVTFLLSSALGVFLIANDNGSNFASAQVSKPVEPTNCTPSPAPTFNGYSTSINNPNIDSTTCQDIPLLSFNNVLAGNPRTRFIQGPTNFQVTYINSAKIADPASAIVNPNLKLAFKKVNDTTYTLSGGLTGTNAAAYTSTTEPAGKGGDLTVTVPAGYKPQYVQRSSRHYDKNVVRDYEASFGSGANPFDYIEDNGTASNPIFSEFAGVTVGSNAGYSLDKSGKLETGFLNGGYVLFTIDIIPDATNTPPQIPGEEITIIRGQKGSFKPLAPTDPENDTPIKLVVNGPLSNCTPATVAAASVIECIATANAPKRSTFTITPTDSRGLVGTPGTFIVNIIDPGLDVVKSCVKKGTVTPCIDAKLAPGDTVTYKLTLTNSGETALSNVVMVDDYDISKLESATNINPTESAHDKVNGKITWNIPSMSKGQVIVGTFDNVIKPSIKIDSTIINNVTATADGVPAKKGTYTFDVKVPNTPPQIPGEEITIIRGQKGSFKPLKPTDPENDVPIKLVINGPLPFCLPTSNVVDGSVIECTTDANTPVRSTFTITPTDSRGLVGTPGTFIVNIIDPGVSLVKECFKKDTTVKCKDAKLLPGDFVTYKLILKNTGNSDLSDVVLTDTYDVSKLTDISSISPAETNLDKVNGKITWNIGKLEKSKEIVGTFNAKVSSVIGSDTIVNNFAKVTSKELPPTETSVDFPVVLPKNTPPQIPGEEIIIIRGKDGSFKPLKPTDPENDTPIKLDPKNLPSFCTPTTDLKDGTVILCKTDDKTPAVSTFTITPTDSKGLPGTPGTFVVRIIDPGMNIFKKCTVKGSALPCSSQLPGDMVTYTITIVNNGQIDLTDVVVTDDYDQTLLEKITNINPDAKSTDTVTGVIVWNVAKLTKGSSAQFTFDATIKVDSADKTILNVARAKSNETPEKKDEVKFDVLGKPVLELIKTCIAIKSGKSCGETVLNPGDKIKYILNLSNTGKSIAKNVTITDDFDQTRLVSILNITPAGDYNSVDGVIVWKLGDLKAGEKLTGSFEASIKSDVVNGTIITNVAIATAEGIPPVQSQVAFPVTVNPPIVKVLGRTGGLTILTTWGLLFSVVGGYVWISKKKKTGDNFIHERSREEK